MQSKARCKGVRNPTKSWARNPESKGAKATHEIEFRIHIYLTNIRNPRIGIRNPRVRIRNQGNEICALEFNGFLYTG